VLSSDGFPPVAAEHSKLPFIHLDDADGSFDADRRAQIALTTSRVLVMLRRSSQKKSGVSDVSSLFLA